jgi:dynein heavy chain
MFSNRYLATFEETVTYWNKGLASIAEIVLLAGEVQRTWSFLENLFIHSEEVKKELPKQSEAFIGIDKDVKEILADGYKKQVALDFCSQPNVLPDLERVQKELTVCEKALYDFMGTKRAAFPRFHFVSQNDLLDILSNGNNPSKVMVHMPKIFQAIDTLELKDQGAGARPSAKGMHTSVGKEYVDFSKELALEKKVENYLQDVIDMMRRSLKDIAADSRIRFGQKEKSKWLADDPAQVTLLINMVNWVVNVETAFENKSMLAALEEQRGLLNDLILMVQGDLTPSMRQKIASLITMDAHSRDIIDKLIQEGVESKDEFQW